MNMNQDVFRKTPPVTLTGWIIMIEDKYFLGCADDGGNALFTDDISNAMIITGKDRPIATAEHVCYDYVRRFSDDGVMPKVLIFECSINVFKKEELK